MKHKDHKCSQLAQSYVPQILTSRAGRHLVIKSVWASCVSQTVSSPVLQMHRELCRLTRLLCGKGFTDIDDLKMKSWMYVFGIPCAQNRLIGDI